MDLWIRSQDKKLLEKINSFEIVDESTIQANGFPYGTYKDKERALEVLNEIQNILIPKMVYKNITEDEAGIEKINQYFNNNVHFNTSNNADIHFINDTYVYESH